MGLILGKRLKVSGAGREGGGNEDRSETASELLLAVLLSAAAMGAKGDCASARRPHGRDARGQNATRRDVLESFCLSSRYSTFFETSHATLRRRLKHCGLSICVEFTFVAYLGLSQWRVAWQDLRYGR